MNEITRILNRIDQNDPQAAELLLPLVYDELRRLASARLAHEQPGQTLDATALVHEAYLRLVASPVAPAPEGKQATPVSPIEAPPHPCSPAFNSRGHFFAAAAEAMRRILVERARRKGRMRHGGGQQRVPLESIEAPANAPPDDLLALDEALTQFTALDASRAELVKLRFFAGLSVEEAAECLGISRATADRWWSFARAWLYAKVTGVEKSEDS
jgi:RNA polymerase sigma factor (sigma-70 family)